MARYIRNISYFCIMKRLYAFLLIYSLILPFTDTVVAQDTGKGQHISAHTAIDDVMAAADEKCATQTTANDGRFEAMQFSLITCSPHDEVYSLYGHSALRVKDEARGEDTVINYGIFSFSKPFFVLRFVFGLTDYEVWPVPYYLFISEYQRHGCRVTEQVLNLRAEEKEKLYNALAENCLPENRVYRYNFVYDNCTTRVRDMVCQNTEGKVEFMTSVPDNTTLRSLTHEMTQGHPWARLGNDMLLGIGADRQMDKMQMQFLPQKMSEAFDSAYICRDEVKAPLVISKSTLFDGNETENSEATLFTPMMAAVLIFLLTAVMTAVEWKRKMYFWWFDGILETAVGLAGIVITAMLFSQHPTVNANILILLFNPLPLCFGIQAIAHRNKKQKHWLWKIKMIMLCLMIVLYSFGVQYIDPAVLLTAVALLMRCAVNAVAANEVENKKHDA